MDHLKKAQSERGVSINIFKYVKWTGVNGHANSAIQLLIDSFEHCFEFDQKLDVELFHYYYGSDFHTLSRKREEGNDHIQKWFVRTPNTRTYEAFSVEIPDSRNVQ